MGPHSINKRKRRKRKEKKNTKFITKQPFLCLQRLLSFAPLIRMAATFEARKPTANHTPPTRKEGLRAKRPSTLCTRPGPGLKRNQSQTVLSSTRALSLMAKPGGGGAHL